MVDNRAQRLAASKIVSPSSKKEGAKRDSGCSTPCGIKDSFTFDIMQALKNFVKCSTPCGIKDSFTTAAALTGIRKESAQRLAASKIVSQVGDIQQDRRDRVLNALRHQR